MSISLKEQAEKIIAHADENGVAAIYEEDFQGCKEEIDHDLPDDLIHALRKVIEKRDKGDILLAVGNDGTADLTYEEYPTDESYEVRGRASGCCPAPGHLIFLFISFKKNFYVKNEMNMEYKKDEIEA